MTDVGRFMGTYPPSLCWLMGFVLPFLSQSRFQHQLGDDPRFPGHIADTPPPLCRHLSLHSLADISDSRPRWLY